MTITPNHIRITHILLNCYASLSEVVKGCSSILLLPVVFHRCRLLDRYYFLFIAITFFTVPFVGHITMFTDATTLFYSACSIESLKTISTHDLRLLSIWLSYNKLNINVTKWCYLNISLSTVSSS